MGVHRQTNNWTDECHDQKKKTPHNEMLCHRKPLEKSLIVLQVFFYNFASCKIALNSTCVAANERKVFVEVCIIEDATDEICLRH